MAELFQYTFSTGSVSAGGTGTLTPAVQTGRYPFLLTHLWFRSRSNTLFSVKLTDRRRAMSWSSSNDTTLSGRIPHTLFGTQVPWRLPAPIVIPPQTIVDLDYKNEGTASDTLDGVLIGQLLTNGEPYSQTRSFFAHPFTTGSITAGSQGVISAVVETSRWPFHWTHVAFASRGGELFSVRLEDSRRQWQFSSERVPHALLGTVEPLELPEPMKLPEATALSLDYKNEGSASDTLDGCLFGWIDLEGE